MFSISTFSQIIYVDPGHGYGTSVNDNPDGRTATEIETNLAVGLKLRTLLTSNCSSVIVHMSRTTNLNGWVNVSARALQAQNWNSDRLLSIHCNADGDEENDAAATSTATGTETYYSTATKTTANSASASVHIAFAKKVNAELALSGSQIKRNNGTPILRNDLGIFGRSTTACLNEIGFVDNASQKTKLLSDAWRQRFALGYYKALKANLNMSCSGASAAAPRSFTLKVTPQCSGVTSRFYLSWTASANATSYDIYRNGVLWDSNVTSTNYTNTSGITAGATYTYYVKAKNSVGTLKNSNGTISVKAKRCAAKGGFEENTFTREELSLSVFPNPTNDIVNLKFDNSDVKNIHYVIMDINGKILKEGNLNNENIINISQLPSSIYLIRVIADGQEFIKKVIKK